MDLENKKTKIIFLIVSTILVIVFTYFSFAKKEEPEDRKSRTHLLKRGKGDSNLEKTRRTSRTYDRDVKDYSFNDYINDQKDGDVKGQQNHEEINPQEDEKPKSATSNRNRFSQLENEGEETVPVKKTTKSKSSTSSETMIMTETESEPQSVQEIPKQQVRRTGFSGGGAKTIASNNSQNVAINSENIKAVIMQTKKIKSGDNILLRTTEQSIIEGRAIPENTLVAGLVTLSGSRLNIKISAIALGEESIVCKLNAYDLDGNLGLKMNKDISYEVKNESVGSVVGEVANTVNVPYIGRIASDVGNKVIEDPTVTLNQGQKMFLRTSN